jgi:hypothetical protein
VSNPSWGIVPPVVPGRGGAFDTPRSLEHVYGRRPEYVYLAAELFSNRAICDLPLTNVQFNWAVNAAGKFSATVNVSALARKHEYFEATEPCKTVIYVIRDGIPIWGGIIWKRTFDSEKRELRIDAETWDSYLVRRIASKDIVVQFEPPSFPGRTKFGMEQVEIFRQLWGFMSQTTNSDINVKLGSLVTPVRRGVSVTGSNYESYYKILHDDIATKYDGFEWFATVGLASNGTDIERRIEFAYPRFARSYEETGLVWEYPGNILKYEWIANAEGARNVVFVTGPGSGADQTVVGKKNQESYDQGYPRMDSIEKHPGIAEAGVLSSHAEKYLYAYQPPVNDIQVDPHPTVPQHLGQFFIGDIVRFIIKDDMFKYADIKDRDLLGRIIDIAITPNDEGLEQIKPKFRLESRNLLIMDPDDKSSDLVPASGWNGLTLDPADTFPPVIDEPEARKGRRRSSYHWGRTDTGVRGLRNSLKYGDDPWGGAMP